MSRRIGLKNHKTINVSRDEDGCNYTCNESEQQRKEEITKQLINGTCNPKVRTLLIIGIQFETILRELSV